MNMWFVSNLTLLFKTFFFKRIFLTQDKFIYWCNLEINIGSEKNKLRPIINLKTSKKFTNHYIIPLTTKKIQNEF